MENIKEILDIDEKRLRERYKYNKNVICTKYIKFPEKKIITSMLLLNIVDISYGGLGIITKHELSIGDILTFNIPNNGVVREMKLQVEWAQYGNKLNRYGIEYIDLTKNDIYFIHDIIKTLQ